MYALSMSAAAMGLQFQDVAKTGSIKKVAFGQRFTKCREILAGTAEEHSRERKNGVQKPQLNRGDFGVIITFNKEKE